MSNLTFFDRISLRNRVAALALSAVFGLSVIGLAQYYSGSTLTRASADFEAADAKYEALSVLNRKILALKVAEQNLRAERKAAALAPVDASLAAVSGFLDGRETGAALTQSFTSYIDALAKYRETLDLLGYRDRQSVVVAEGGQQGINTPAGYTVDASNIAAKTAARIYEELEFDDQPAVFQVALSFETLQRDIVKIISGEDSSHLTVADKRINDLQELLEDPDLDGDFSSTMANLLKDLSAQLEKLGTAETELAAAEDTLNSSYSALDAGLMEQLKTTHTAAADIRSALNDTRESTAMLIFAAVALTLVTQIGAGVLIVMSVSRNLSEITGATGQLASGNLDHEIPQTRAKTEIGELARALVVFRDNALERRRLESDVETENEAKAARQTEIGNTIEIFKRDIVELLSSAENTIEDAHALAGSLVDASERNSHEAGNANEASELASENVQAVAGATQQLSGAIGEISEQVTQTSRQIEQVSLSANATNADVDQLAEAATKIDEIIVLIQAIAEQTNLLALNATIEAARAGEHGRGFSVVASEVKSLANQTAKATDEISSQIKAIQTSSQTTVAAMSQITGIIAEVQESTVAIVGAIEEQTAATNEISQNVGSAADRTQQMAANVSSLRETASDTMQSAEMIRDTSSHIGAINKQVHNRIEAFLHEVDAA